MRALKAQKAIESAHYIMNRHFSLYLDLVRFIAAFVVLLSHFAYPRYTTNTWDFIIKLNLGSDAVVLFFVLSGFVIAYVADKKEYDFSNFLFNRTTRIYSVAIPAVVLTLILDALGSSFNPIAYDGWWHHKAPLLDTLWTALTFTNQWGLDNFRIGTNAPYWSVGYEIWYYLLFGVAFYVKPHLRYFLIAAIAALVGIKILLLMPAWVMGVGVYHISKSKLKLSKMASATTTLLPVLVYFLYLKTYVPTQLLLATWSVLGEQFVSVGLGFSNEFVWNALIGILASIHFIGVVQLTRTASNRPDEPINQNANILVLKKSIRWLAGGTFSLYLMHYPLLQFFSTILPGAPTLLRDGILITLVFIVCYSFASLFERTLHMQRTIIRRISTARLSNSKAIY